MINTLLSFGAKNVNPEILEQTLTVRKEIVDEVEKNCINKAVILSTCQSLIIAPRGSGKTHIIKVLYHRIKNNEAVATKTIVAYMSEDEVGIANFTDLMVSIIRAFIRYNEPGSENLEAQIMEASLISNIDKREIFVKNILRDFAGKRIIFLLIENFDKILTALGTTGQGSLRDFIHQYNNLSIIATSQNLIASLQDSKSPFYNFFNVFQLKKLDFEGTVRFLEAIAKTEDDLALANDIRKPEFEGKLRAIYELTEGNHRLLVTFYSFLKAEYKTDLSGVFIKVMNDLKPYYEQFVNALPPLQQKIVKHLSLNRKAESGKEIARACFIDPNIFSKQISLLFERGMIDKNKSGKDVFYELKEPLMRICFEIGENPNGISKLFVDFLSSYYDRQIIRKQYLKFKYGAKFQCEELKCKFENEALMYSMALNDKEKEEILSVYSSLDEINESSELYNKIENIEADRISDEYFQKGNAFFEKGQFNKAIENYKKVIEINPKDDITYFNMGIAYGFVNEHEKAIESFKKAIEIKPNNYASYNNMGIVYGDLQKYQDAIDCFNKSIEINDNNYAVFHNLGIAYGKLQQYEKAIEKSQKAIEINPIDDKSYYNIGVAYGYLQQYEKAIESYQKVIEINPHNESAYYNKGIAHGYMQQYEKAIESYQKAIEVNPKNDSAYFNIGFDYNNIKQYEKAIESFQKVIEINHNNDFAYFNMGVALQNLQQHAKAVECYQKAIKINTNDYKTFYNMGFAYGKLQQYEKAIKAYQKALEINSKNEDSYNGLGMSYLNVGKIDEALQTFQDGLLINPDNYNLKFSLLGAYIRINDYTQCKDLLTELIDKSDNELLIGCLEEDVFYNLFKYGSQFFIQSYLEFVLNLLIEKEKIKQFWEALPGSLNEILIHFEEYDKERLTNVENILTELLASYAESIIPLKMFGVGISYLKNDEKNALFNLSKEERKLFNEAVLDKRVNKAE